ncbi:MAG: hypothetical protein IT336_03635 [Thermomicrobiales bacterium]|nr:hypothetical protein [Thermomicrobiales bacterium]
MTDTKPKSRRQLIEDARQAALDGEWQRAIELNQSLIDRTPRDADAFNRLGRALLELGRLTAAYDAYSGALKIDPANMIARRNLQRLELLRRGHAGEDQVVGSDEPKPTIPRTNAFIEEVGKTWVDELVEPAPIEILAEVPSGEHLELVVEGQRLVVTRQNGQRLGEIEAKTAERLLELINGGNRYEVYALGLSSNGVRVIIREVYKAPGLANRVSFPRQISYTRAYLRDRDQLRQRDEADFLFSDEDDEDIDEEDSGGHAVDEESAGDTEPDAFEEDTVVVEEEESPI